ncbi:MAG: cobalamin biosynthesis protein [Pseudomonadota bacterium]
MIVAGFGCRQAATQHSFESALNRAMQAASACPDALATLDTKSQQLRQLAAQKNLPLLLFDLECLQSQQTMTQSDAAHAVYGTGSIAEAAAIAASGPKARLLSVRVISEDQLATCALAAGD